MSTTIASLRFILATLLVIILCGAPRAAADPPAQPIAGGVQFEAGLQSSIDEMLRTSPTFRSQYQRLLSTPSLIVGVRVDPALVGRAYRAMSTIRRFKSGLVVAAVVVGPGAGQPGWIAHEIEHVLEQLDGLDLHALARQSASGVYYSSATMIETARAIQAGRTVSIEMRGSRTR